MSSPKPRVEAAEREAAAWHVHLGERSVSTETIEEFFAWRASPENAEAYHRIEAAWAETGRLAADRQIGDALQEVLTRKSRPSPGPAQLLAGLAALGAVIALTFGVWTYMQTRTVFATETGEQRTVELADGSSVRLDTDSRIRVRFDGDQRRIDLEGGQALFTVVPDAQRPFLVDAGGPRVTAVGTVFDVRRTGADIRVTLVEGIVEVRASSGSAATRMDAGHQARVTTAGVRTAPVDADLETSWTEGRIVFRDTPLSEAIVEVNRYLTEDIELRATTAATTPINGVFQAGDREAFVSTASRGLGLDVAPGPDGSILLLERTNN